MSIRAANGASRAGGLNSYGTPHASPPRSPSIPPRIASSIVHAPDLCHARTAAFSTIGRRDAMRVSGNRALTVAGLDDLHSRGEAASLSLPDQHILRPTGGRRMPLDETPSDDDPAR